MCAGDPPVSIPTTVVKPRCADGTGRVTAWERRSSLDSFWQAQGFHQDSLCLFYSLNCFATFFQKNCVMEHNREKNLTIFSVPLFAISTFWEEVFTAKKT
jgi:hypothetical protein